MEAVGDLQGNWDGPRLQQLLRNLVSNALTYGAPATPVRVVLVGSETEVRIEVTNSGTTIEHSALKQIFDPLKRGAATGDGREAHGSMGLGLYIVRAIARAHGGEVEARSDAGETVFSVSLPRGVESTPS